MGNFIHAKDSESCAALPPRLSFATTNCDVTCPAKPKRWPEHREQSSRTSKTKEKTSTDVHFVKCPVPVSVGLEKWAQPKLLVRYMVQICNWGYQTFHGVKAAENSTTGLSNQTQKFMLKPLSSERHASGSSLPLPAYWCFNVRL